MTDRIQSLTVILDRDYRDDDAEVILHAIRMIKGVARVELGTPVGPDDHFARARAAMNLEKKLLSVLRGNGDEPL